MKTKNIILLVFGFLAASAAYAQQNYYSYNIYQSPVIANASPMVLNNSYMYLNFLEEVNSMGSPVGNIWIIQNTYSCENTTYGMRHFNCVVKLMNESFANWNGAAFPISKTAEVINSFFENHDGYKQVFFNTVTNGNDIFDFGELSITSNGEGYDTTCVTNHVPLHFSSSVDTVDFQGKTIANLCHIYDPETAPKKLTSLGLLDSLKGIFVKNATLKNVHFSVKSAKSLVDWNQYPATGALSGAMDEDTVENISLVDVSIAAPHAGGLVGRAWNTLIQNVSGDDDIVVSNNVEVKPWNADIRLGEYTTYLGGLVGVGYDLALNNISLVSKVTEEGSNTTSALGGLVGGYILSSDPTGQTSKIVLEELDLPKKSETSFTKVSGGKAMGGIIGELSVANGFTGGARAFAIKDSKFFGRLQDSKYDSTFAGGFVGSTVGLADGSLEILNSESNLNFDEDAKISSVYKVGGFVGNALFASSRNKSEKNLYLSIRNSQSSGKIRLVKGSGVSPVVSAFLGGLVGEGSFSFDGSSMVSDTSYVEITANLGKSSDSLLLGGFVGKVDCYAAAGVGANIAIDGAVFGGSITVDKANGHAFAGGLVGYNLENTAYDLTINNSAIANDTSLINFGSSKDDLPGTNDIGGLCGYCKSITKIENVSVIGDIKVGGVSNKTDSVNVGGLVGYFVSQPELYFGVEKSFFRGDIVVSENLSTAKVGYLFGHANLGTSGTGQNRRLVSTYHVGQDTYDAFGKLEGLYHPHGDNNDWTNTVNVCLTNASAGQCWDFRNNVRNVDDNASMSGTNNGTVGLDYMRNALFLGLLNAPYDDDDPAWDWSEDENDGFPYLLGKAPTVNPPTESSSSSEMSSSSEEPASSSSEMSSSSEEPASSSSEMSSSSEEPASSSSEMSSSSEEPASSSSEMSSSSEEPASSSSEMSSSSEKPASSSSEMSSSSEEPASSSSEMSSSSEEPVSSSSEMSSSSEDVVPPSSSEDVVVAEFVEPKILSDKVRRSGDLTTFSFGVKVDSTAGKVGARLRLFNGMETIYDSVVVDSISLPLEELPVSIVSLPAGKISYEFELFCDAASSFVKGEIVVKDAKNDVVTANSWRMVSIANLDFEGLVLDERNSLYWWNESNEFGDYWQYQAYAPSDNGPATRGYWFGTFDGALLNRKVASYDPDKAEIIWDLDSVYSGWNMVANPYGWKVDISELADSLEIWNWNTKKGKYEQYYELNPYEAVWVHASEAKVVRIPAKPVYSSGKSLAKKTALARVGDGWTIQATLYDKFGKDDSWNMFGVNNTAFESEEPPSGMGDYVALSFMDGKRALAKSFKQDADELEWSVRLSASSDRVAYLKLDGVKEATASGNKVFVTIDGKTTEMKDGESLQVKVGSRAKYATIRVASAPRAEVEYALKDVRAFHSGNALDVQFSATDGLAGALATVELVGIDGRVSASASTKVNAGSNAVAMTVPDRGLYVLRVRAGSQVLAKNIMLK